MQLKEVLKKLDGEHTNVKIGSKINYIYCGKVKDFSILFKNEEIKEEKRIKTMLETYESNVAYLTRMLEDEKYNKKVIERMEISEELSAEQKKGIIKGKTEKIQKYNKDLQNNKARLAEYIQLKKDFCAIYDREVLEIYPSITENATIIIIKGGEQGRYWNSKEYKRLNKGE